MKDYYREDIPNIVHFIKPLFTVVLIIVVALSINKFLKVESLEDKYSSLVIGALLDHEVSEEESKEYIELKASLENLSKYDIGTSAIESELKPILVRYTSKGEVVECNALGTVGLVGHSLVNKGDNVLLTEDGEIVRFSGEYFIEER